MKKILLSLFLSLLPFVCDAQFSPPPGGGGTGGGSVTSVTDNSGLFSIANPTTTPTFTFANAGANTVFGNNTGSAATPAFQNFFNLASGANGNTLASSSANAFSVGLNGTTNPAFNIDASTALSATGINIKSAAGGAGVTLSMLSSSATDTFNIRGISPSTGAIGGAVIIMGGAAGTGIFAGGSVTIQGGTTTASSGATAAGAVNINGGVATGGAGGAVNITAGGGSAGFASGAVVIRGAAGVGAAGGSVSIIAGGSNAAQSGVSTTIKGGAGGTSGNQPGGQLIIGGGASNGTASPGLVNIQGDIEFTGSPPVITSCGGGTLVTGSTDHKGQITGITAATACTITFSQNLGTAPACSFSSNNAITPTGIPTITGVTTSMTALTGAMSYLCF